MPGSAPVPDGVIAGDVIVRPGDGDTVPAFVVRREPGPDQFGCATLAGAARLARAFAAAAGVDVWLADPVGRVTALARYRGLERSAAPPARVGSSVDPRAAEPSGQNRTVWTGAELYSGVGPPA